MSLVGYGLIWQSCYVHEMHFDYEQVHAVQVMLFKLIIKLSRGTMRSNGGRDERAKTVPAPASPGPEASRHRAQIASVQAGSFKLVAPAVAASSLPLTCWRPLWLPWWAPLLSVSCSVSGVVCAGYAIQLVGAIRSGGRSRTLSTCYNCLS